MDTPQAPHSLTNQQAEAMWRDIDRRHTSRCNCGLGGIAKSVAQSRPQPVSLGGSFPVTVSDLSPTGMRLQTPHELGVGDELEVIVDSPGGAEPLRQNVRVVWAGQTAQEQWCAGVEYLNAA